MKSRNVFIGCMIGAAIVKVSKKVGEAHGFVAGTGALLALTVIVITVICVLFPWK
jgi:hypothetical protein